MTFKNEQEYFEELTYNFGCCVKPIVHYTTLWNTPEKGYSAVLTVVDHPATHLNNFPCVHTSYVVSYDKETGVIETRNTIYKPKEIK